jgi:hypothetical protein
MIKARQTAPVDPLRPEPFIGSGDPAFLSCYDPSNQAEDWQEAANKLKQVTLIAYFGPEPAEPPQIDPVWAAFAEEASKRWFKDNPF